MGKGSGPGGSLEKWNGEQSEKVFKTNGSIGPETSGIGDEMR